MQTKGVIKPIRMQREYKPRIVDKLLTRKLAGKGAYFCRKLKTERCMKRITYTILSLLFIALNVQGQATPNKEVVIEQMNYCINSLTNISQNKSLDMLDHEQDQLLNNLTMEQMAGLQEVAEFRKQLLQSLNSVSMTQQEKEVVRRMRNNTLGRHIWKTAADFINRPAVTGALLSIARTTVDYQLVGYGQGQEELKALWELKKVQMNEVTTLRKEALELVFRLYQRFQLDERDRLTEASALLFNQIVNEPDNNKRIRLLRDNFTQFKNLSDYYYFLGMAYIDVNDYVHARPQLEQYEARCKRAPIFRYNEKLGCVYLARLIFEQKLNNAEKQRLVDEVLHNLPNNGAALIQCAMVLLNDLKQEERAIDLLRSGVDNSQVTDRDAIVLTLAQLMPRIKAMPAMEQQVKDAVYKCDDLTLNSYIAFVVNDHQPNIWEALPAFIQIDDAFHRPWYFFGKHFNGEFRMLLPANFSLDRQQLAVYWERNEGQHLYITEGEPSLSMTIEREEVFDEVDCFQKDPSMMYLFLSSVDGKDLLQVKPHLDYDAIQKNELPGMKELSLSDADIASIIEFCKKHEPEKGCTVLNVRKGGAQGSFENDSISFEGDTLRYTPRLTSEERTLLRVIFADMPQTIVTFAVDSDEQKLDIYSVESNGQLFYKDKAPEAIGAKTLAWYEEIWHWLWGILVWLWELVKGIVVWLWHFIWGVAVWCYNYVMSFF